MLLDEFLKRNGYARFRLKVISADLASLVREKLEMIGENRIGRYYIKEYQTSNGLTTKGLTVRTKEGFFNLESRQEDLCTNMQMLDFLSEIKTLLESLDIEYRKRNIVESNK